MENTPIFPGEWHRKLNSKRITVIAARVEALHFRPQFMSFGPFMEGHGVNVIQYGPVWPIMARYNIPLTGAALPAAPAALRHHSALPVGRRGGTRAAPPPRLRPRRSAFMKRGTISPSIHPIGVLYRPNAWNRCGWQSMAVGPKRPHLGAADPAEAATAERRRTLHARLGVPLRPSARPSAAPVARAREGRTPTSEAPHHRIKPREAA